MLALLRRYLSAAAMTIPTVSYAEVRAVALGQKAASIIDVRQADEIQATGLIPTSHNIPRTCWLHAAKFANRTACLPTTIVASVQRALQTATDDFEEEYGFAKPPPNGMVIFTCRSGARALTAAEAAKRAGYANVYSYPGSWTEWAAKVSADK